MLSLNILIVSAGKNNNSSVRRRLKKKAFCAFFLFVFFYCYPLVCGFFYSPLVYVSVFIPSFVVHFVLHYFVGSHMLFLFEVSAYTMFLTHVACHNTSARRIKR